jgi:hypothetical protein
MPASKCADCPQSLGSAISVNQILTDDATECYTLIACKVKDMMAFDLKSQTFLGRQKRPSWLNFGLFAAFIDR